MENTTEATGTQGSTENMASDGRLLATACYLLMFMGTFVLGPLAIYFLVGKRRPFVAWHAAQSVLIGALMVGSAVAVSVGYAFFLILGLVVPGPVAQVVAVVGVIVSALVVAVVPTAMAFLGAWNAFHGRRGRLWLVAPATRRFLEARGEGAFGESSG
ncbi:MAG: hypothetical protein KC731_26675 [Myxococcales bacterium]|nr:hypothetical protein [Myxococcales bacterium]